MFYAEYPPHPSLANQVRCIWVFDSMGKAADAPDDNVQTIVPDGYPEMVLHYGDRFAELGEDGTAATQSRHLFAGQISRPLRLKPGESAGVIGVRFQTVGARAVLGMQMHLNTDTRLDLAAAWGRESDHLLDEIYNAAGPVARVHVVERFLIRKLANSHIAQDGAVACCVEALRRAAPGLTVDRLATQSQLSARQLERRFLHEVGLSPRLLASIFRFRRLFDAVESDAPHRWASAAIAAGYFDQAHMIRDFKRFAGGTPAAFQSTINGFSAAMLGTDR